MISTSETGPSKSSTAKNPQEDEPFPEDVARELAEGMEKLMRELSGGAGAGASSEDPEEARKRAQAWEKMLVDGMNGTHEDTLGPEQRPKAGPSTEDAFQASILQAMEKLKNSDSALHVGLALRKLLAKLICFFCSRMQPRPQPQLMTLSSPS